MTFFQLFQFRRSWGKILAVGFFARLIFFSFHENNYKWSENYTFQFSFYAMLFMFPSTLYMILNWIRRKHQSFIKTEIEMVMRHKKTTCFLSQHTLVDKSKGLGKDTGNPAWRSTRRIYIELSFLVLMILRQKWEGLHLEYMLNFRIRASVVTLIQCYFS